MTMMSPVAVLAQEIDPNDESIDEPAVFHELVNEVVREPERYRAFVKDAMTGHLGAMGMIVTQRTPLVEHMAIHAKAMLALAQLHKSIYAAGTGTADAAPEIWSDPETFAVLQDGFAKTAADLVAATENGNSHAVLGQLMRLGERCHNCHETFRISGE
jgi:cytochrome c556